jgi:hypothetical protein
LFVGSVLESSAIIASGFESYSMADYACYLIANKAQHDVSLKGFHVVFSVV